jgi:hypothetical protein
MKPGCVSGFMDQHPTNFSSVVTLSACSPLAIAARTSFLPLCRRGRNGAIPSKTLANLSATKLTANVESYVLLSRLRWWTIGLRGSATPDLNGVGVCRI